MQLMFVLIRKGYGDVCFIVLKAFALNSMPEIFVNYRQTGKEITSQ